MAVNNICQMVFREAKDYLKRFGSGLSNRPAQTDK